MSARGPDAATLFERALSASAILSGASIAVRSVDTRRWASATFVGARHRLVLDAPDDSGVRLWLDDLPEAEFDLRGHLVADCAVVECVRRDGRYLACVEALTVEDA
jgi:hypothetical protein